MLRVIARLVFFLVIVVAGIAAWSYYAASRSADSFSMFAVLNTPDTFPITEQIEADYPILSWQEYEVRAEEILPPYFIQFDTGNDGAVFMFGAEYGRPPEDSQFRLMKKTWDEFNPTVALLEGRMGFLMPYFLDPVETFGESGQTAALAKKANVPYYSWELSKKDEIEALRNTHSREQVAMFIILRPYLGSVTNDIRLPNADGIVAKLIETRGDRQGIRGTINTVEDIDRIWQRDFPDKSDWRDTGFGITMPGYMGELFEQSSRVRDMHLLNNIMNLTAKGERVYVSAGWAHVVRLEPVFAGDARAEAAPAEAAED